MAVHIQDKKVLQEKIDAMRSAGKELLHVISDFDATMTRVYDVFGNKIPSVFEILRQNALSPDAAKKEKEMADYYYPIEIDPSMTMEEKTPYMIKWWALHLQLMIDDGIGKDYLEKLLTADERMFRSQLSSFISLLSQHNIPLLVFSAGLGEPIEGFMKKEGLLLDNVHIISNFFTYDKNDKISGYEQTPIHTFNKDEGHVLGTGYEAIVKEKKNVILLGDTLGDLKMTGDVSHDTVITIGYLSKNIEDQLESYMNSFDVVITGDGDMSYAIELVEKITA